MLIYANGNKLPEDVLKSAVIVTNDFDFWKNASAHDTVVIYEKVTYDFLAKLKNRNVICKVANDAEGIRLYNKHLITNFFLDNDDFIVKKMVKEKRILKTLSEAR